jgi:hypothetical protein
MAGHRLEIDSIGESYEVFAESVLSRIAALTRIGTKQEFGTDMYCLPRIKTTERMEAVTELCLLQVKGGRARLEYGGLLNGGWRAQEISWLKSLWAPLYLATVDDAYQRVNLYSLSPIWWVMWQCGTPFKIVCSWRESSEALHTFVQPEPDTTTTGAEYGDGRVWRIDLGPPILQLTHQSLNHDAFRDRAVDILRRWVSLDRQTVARFHTGIPFVQAFNKWATNQVPPGEGMELLAMDARLGMNIERLARALVPSVLGLGAHLQHQDNSDAYRLIPILEWIESNRYGNSITPILLESLLRTQRDGVSPATYIRLP